MADYPGGIYDPRTKENKPGIVYTPAKTKIGYAEDLSKLDAEVVAIENELGVDFKDWLANNYIPYSDILLPLNVFGGRKVFIPELNSVLYKADTRMTVTQTGFDTWDQSKLFSLDYNSRNKVLMGDQGIITIDTTPDWGATGTTYPQGYIVLSFYHTYIPESVSGRYKDMNDDWRAFVNPVNIASGASYAIWRLTVPGNPFGKIFEITLNAKADKDCWICQIDYFLYRRGPQKLPWQV